MMTPFLGYSQTDEYELKALLVLSVSEETRWSNEDQISTFRIGVVGDREVYAKLNGLVSSKRIHGKHFQVKYLKSLGEHSSENILVLNNTSANSSDLNKAIGKNILSIVEDNKAYTSSCVNIFIGDNNQLEFTVNAKKFETQLLHPSASLLVYATNKTDAIRMINQSKKELEDLKEDYNSQLKKYQTLQDQMKSLQTAIDEGEQEIKDLQAEIQASEEGLIAKDREYLALQRKMDDLKAEYHSAQLELASASEHLSKSAAELDALRSDLNEQRTEIDANQEILNEQEQQLLDQEQRLKDQEEELIESGEVISTTTRLIWIITGITLLLAVIIIFIIRENRAKKRSLAIINEKNEEVIEASRHKDEFISNLSHEVRTPLNAIIGYTNLVHDHVKNEEDRKYLNYVNLSSKNLLRIINDILDLKKIESGKLELEHEDFQLKEIVLDTFHTTELLVTQKSIIYHLNYDDQLPKMVVGDPVKINQVLLNLLGNSAKFTEEGKIELCVRLIDQTDEKVNVEFEVADTGIGISPDKIDQIFESFTQANEDISKTYGGTGLGLSIARKFVELMGGEIRVKSKQGVGTSFIFNVPFDKSTGAAPVSIDKSEIDKHALDGIKIAFADDLPINRELFVRQMKDISEGIHVEVASNGEDLAHMVMNKDFDLVFTDVQMPIMDGVDATKLIRQTNRDIKIVGLSARVLQKDIDRYLESGMNDYISKPYSLNDLIVKMAEQLGLELRAVPVKEKEDAGFQKIWNMSQNQEEYEHILKGLIEDIDSNLNDLEADPSNAKLAHSLLNKIIYLDQEELINACRTYEEHCHEGTGFDFNEEVKGLSKKIREFLK